MNEKFFSNLLFAAVPPEELHRLGLHIEECHYDTGDIVFEDGDPGKDIFLVAEGSVRISKRGRGGKQETLTVELENGFFGEMAVLDGQMRSARATAESPALLGRMSKQELDRLFSLSPGAARHFAELITRQLRTANTRFIDELIQTERLSLLGTMMSSIVHDFRNPISTIAMVGHYLSTHDDPKLNELGSLTHDAIDAMQDMIQELLDFSRGTTRLDRKPTGISDLVAELDKAVLAKLEGSGIEVIREIDYHGEIRVDSHRLMRLLLNIIKNSREAMMGGGILTIRVGQHGEQVKFEIEDTGCGIKPEIMNRIFEPFVTDGKSSGTGLGMAIAKSVVEAHQGRIWIESQEGLGTCCHIELPLDVPETEPIPGFVGNGAATTAGAV